MKRLLLLAVVLLTACAGATGPSTTLGHDPTARITNATPDTLVFSWTDPNGPLPSDTLRGAGTYCERFTATAGDSAYFTVTARLANDSTTWASNGSPWFTLSAPPAWTVVVTNNPNPNVLVKEDSTGTQ